MHDALVSGLDRPFRFLDIACGDASCSSVALRGTKVSHYRGVDFSSVALDLARKAIAPLGIPADFEECDCKFARNSDPLRGGFRVQT